MSDLFIVFALEWAVHSVELFTTVKAMNANPRRIPIILAGITVLLGDIHGRSAAAGNEKTPHRPNFVFLMCDDLGYGDVHCLAPETGKIATPHADQLAREGMVFTDAHSGSSVCTPTRYGLMTGRYSWRTRLQKGVVTGFAPSLIDADRPTVASFLKSHGYATAVIGKWHLDFQYLNPRSGEAYSATQYKLPPIGAKIPDGPIHRGFDYFHGFHHARNMEAVVENDRVIAHDDVKNMLPRLTEKSVAYLDSRRDQDSPFFLYIPLGSPHTPIVPTSSWKGTSGLGDYGDFVMQTDHVVGEVAKALQRNGLANNTLFIFTSDNGCSKAAGIPELAKQGHLVSGPLRGSKADIWDGGHRIPFIARWPGVIAPGTTNQQLICLVDFFATAAAILGQPLPPDSCEDSVSFANSLREPAEPIKSSRNGVIHHSYSGHFAYRRGPWKLILAKGSGGWSRPKENQVAQDAPVAQLYDMASDPSEQVNLYSKRPDIVAELLQHLRQDVERGRSTSGPASKNDIKRIVLWKSGGPNDPKKLMPNRSKTSERASRKRKTTADPSQDDGARTPQDDTHGATP